MMLAGPVAIGVVNAPRLRAQLQTGHEQALVFEVASVKANRSGDGRASVEVRGGRFTARDVPLRDLIRTAYGTQVQLVGAPNWIASDRFDIVAQGDLPPLPPDQWTSLYTNESPGPMTGMIRALL